MWNPITTVMLEIKSKATMSRFSKNIFSNQFIAHIPGIPTSHSPLLGSRIYILACQVTYSIIKFYNVFYRSPLLGSRIYILACQVTYSIIKFYNVFYHRGKNISFRNSHISSTKVRVTSKFLASFIISNKRNVIGWKSHLMFTILFWWIIT